MTVQLWGPYPCVIKFGLYANIIPFFFILGSQYLELVRLQRAAPYKCPAAHVWWVPRIFATDLSASAASGIKLTMLAIRQLGLRIPRFIEDINTIEGAYMVDWNPF